MSDTGTEVGSPLQDRDADGTLTLAEVVANVRDKVIRDVVARPGLLDLTTDWLGTLFEGYVREQLLLAAQGGTQPPAPPLDVGAINSRLDAIAQRMRDAPWTGTDAQWDNDYVAATIADVDAVRAALPGGGA